MAQADAGLTRGPPGQPHLAEVRPVQIRYSTWLRRSCRYELGEGESKHGGGIFSVTGCTVSCRRSDRGEGRMIVSEATHELVDQPSVRLKPPIRIRSATSDIILWLLFPVCLGVLPVIWGEVARFSSGQLPSLTGPVARGDLLLVAVVVLAAAMGDLARSPRGFGGVARKLLAAQATVVLILATGWFADLAVLAPDERHAVTSTTLFGSLAVLLASTVIGACCTLLARADF